MKKTKIFLSLLVAVALGFSACMKDLDVLPTDGREVTSADLFDNPAAYQQVLAKLYAGLALSGQEGPAGIPDISGIDEGFGQYLRALWYHQTLSTDEAVIGWDDQTIKDFVYQSWTPADVFIAAMYYRIFYQISLTNEFLRQTTDALLDDRGVTGNLRQEIAGYRLEARFLRALSYWHALDIFGNVPFVTEDDPVGAFLPPQINRSDLFSFIETELLDIAPQMVPPRSANYYGRADQGAAWMLLAKLYLNAEVYTGTARYADCITYCNNIITAGYGLEPQFAHLFNADNYLSDNEIIFRVPYHGINTQTYGGTNFIIHAQIGGAMTAADYGVDGGWGGLRTTKSVVNLYAAGDPRAMFFTDGQNLEIDNLSEFTDGYASIKFTNLTREGTQGSNLAFVDTDFPMFRLADVYLMYAEAVLRGGGGDQGLALSLVNAIRERAWGSTAGNISAAQLTLDFILDERARELFWEAHRRTDLIRYGKFAGNTGYVWPWKGNSRDGLEVNDRFNLFPIPTADINANPNLTQNQGYTGGN